MLYQVVYWENPNNHSLSSGGTRNERVRPKWYAGPERLGTTTIRHETWLLNTVALLFIWSDLCNEVYCCVLFQSDTTCAVTQLASWQSLGRRWLYLYSGEWLITFNSHLFVCLCAQLLLLLRLLQLVYM